MYGQKVVVILLQNTGVKSSQVGLSADVLVESFRWSKVTSKDKVGAVYFRSALAFGQDAAVAYHRANVVMPVHDGRAVRQKRSEVIADRKDVFVTGIVVMHQLPSSYAILGQRKISDYVHILENLSPAEWHNETSILVPVMLVHIITYNSLYCTVIVP